MRSFDNQQAVCDGDVTDQSAYRMFSWKVCAWLPCPFERCLGPENHNAKLGERIVVIGAHARAGSGLQDWCWRENIFQKPRRIFSR